MSRQGSITTTFVAALACACTVDTADSMDTFASSTADPDSSGGAGESDGGAADSADDGANDGADGADGQAETTTGPGPSDESGSEGGPVGDDSSGGSGDPTGGGDSSEPHGEGMCGGGFGASNDLAHVPLCPSDPATMHERFNATRGNYYHDGEHVFEPGVVAWDDTIAAEAQAYAEAYAAGTAPNGMEYYTPAYPFDPYWDGTWQGYRAIVGMETATSCTCGPADPFFGPTPSAVFYNAGSAYFRANVVRIDGMSRMGVGHVAPGDGTHYWAFLFAE